MARSYTQVTIKLLFGTATHCAYPGCKRSLIFKDRELYTPTAQIAHIRSEKKNGPRHDAAYPLGKLNDFENLLLLCGDHHPPIDRHESSYSIEELTAWKIEQSRQGERQVGEAELAAIERIINREPPITSDAVLRGPISSLGQSERLRQAEERLKETPLESAALLDQVAVRLEGSPFVHHAAIIRSRQCMALEAGESSLEAARLRVDLGWRHYFSGDVFSVSQQLQEIEKYRESLPESIQRAVGGLSYSAAFGYERGVSLDDLAEVFDQMEIADQGYLNVATALAEEAVTWRRLDLINSRISALRSLVSESPRDEHSLTLAVRLRMCMAEAEGDWSDLTRNARSTYSPAIAAWIAARHARYLCLTGHPDEGTQRWQDAVDGAVTARLNDSAADWLYSLRAARVQYWRLNEDLNDLHRVAQSLRASGKGSVLPEPYPLAERALSRILDKKWPDALQCLHQNLRHSVVSASWAAELTAHERFGDLFESTEKWSEVPLPYIRSGRVKKLRELAKKWPDQELILDPPADSAPHWEKRAACEFVSFAGRYFSREGAQAWSRYALSEICDSPPNNSQTGVWVPAFSAFSATADEVSLEGARSFLDLMSDSFNRKPGTHHRTDEPLIKAIVKICDSRAEFAPRVVEMLCDAVLLGNEVSDQAMYEGEWILAGNPARVQQRLRGEAERGNPYAALGLVVAGCDTTVCLPVARQKCEEYVRPLVVQAGVTELRVGLADAAILVAILEDSDREEFVKAMMARMLESRDVESNRASAIVAIKIVGSKLRPEARDSTFNSLLEFVRDPLPSAVSMSYGDDPFSRFRVMEGDLSLGALALEAAGRLAHTTEQYVEVQRSAVPLLSSVGSSTCRSIARMLRDLPDGELSMDVEMLANHPSPWLRCFAALAWSRAPERWLGLGDRLSSDSDPGVRLILAKGLKDAPEHESVRTVLRADHRRDVRRLVG
ncbi:HNH endonuclease signature motif containing protein [Streptomyces sp. rh34]|uniref:HNH endonuclease signature motif containing protein n=1 Tax=Streptomyces sp. rh34 TaxID=2034272 RepID=UPI00117C8317|nr:HNH endonuclease signature motif containing protein [Streptomyces sp. rh34]